MLFDCNKTTAEYRRDVCLHELFEDQVARTPSNIAIEFGDQRLTYAGLNRSAGELATRLQRLGVGKNTVVGICLERSPSMLVAVLGVLKAGAAYLPLEAEYPEARLAYMLQNSGAHVLITQRSLRDRFNTLPSHVINVEDEQRTGGETASARVMPDDLAYVIYTSGSNGTPKGVAMPHRPLVNLLHWQIARSGKFPAPRTLQFASLSFEVSFQEIFSTWCGGGTLVLINKDVLRDVESLWYTIARKSVERLFVPFVALQSLAEVAIQNRGIVPRLREIITAGEQLKITPQIRELFSRLNGCVLDNQYGPTEAHIVSAYRLSTDRDMWPELAPIGRPIANTQLYVLDEQLSPGPVGVVGELYISGDCVARGYLNSADTTAVKFVPDPFSVTPGARMYRTGDLARLMSDGNIQFSRP